MRCLEPIQIDRLIRSITEEYDFNMQKLAEQDSDYLYHIQNCVSCCDETIKQLFTAIDHSQWTHTDAITEVRKRIAPTLEVLMGC